LRGAGGNRLLFVLSWQTIVYFEALEAEPYLKVLIMGRLASEVETWLRAGFSFPNLAGQKEIFSSFLLLGIVALFCFNIYPCLLTRFDYPALELRYNNWMGDIGNANWFVSDSDIYAIAGWKYVNGATPDDFNFEHPPLAKYLIGLSELVFGNQNAMSAIFGVLSLLIVYELAKKVMFDPIFSLVPVYMLSLERLYLELSSTSMLDIYLVFFLLLSVLLFITSKSNFRTLLAFATLGLATACKVIAALAFLPIVAVLVMERKRPLKSILVYVLAALLAYCGTYALFFFSGHGLADFVQLQLKMVGLHYGARSRLTYPSGRWLLTLLTGIIGPETRYLIYTGENIGNLTVLVESGLHIAREFNPLTWPLCFSSAVLSLYQGVKTRTKPLIHSSLFFFTFLAFLSIGPAQTWHLLPLFPVGLIILADSLRKIYEESDRDVSLLLLLVYLVSLYLWLTLVKVPTFLQL